MKSGLASAEEQGKIGAGEDGAQDTGARTMPKSKKAAVRECRECGAPEQAGACGQCGASCQEKVPAPRGKGPAALARMEMGSHGSKAEGTTTIQASTASPLASEIRKANTPATIPGRDGKVKRRCNVVWSNGAFSLVTIWQEDRPGSGMGHSQEYMVERHGQGFFTLTKLDPTEKVTYTVFSGSSPEATTCNCKGYRGHSHCKHSAGIQALIGCGKLSR